MQAESQVINCEWLINPAFSSLRVDNGYLLETAANTVLSVVSATELCEKFVEFLGTSTTVMRAFCWFSRHLKEGSDLSASVGAVLEHRGCDGYRGIGVWFRRGSLRDGYHAQGWQQARKLPNCLLDRGSDEK